MLLVYSSVFIFFISKLSYCQRRIVSGIPIRSDKSYAAYLVKAPASNQNYDHWMCGAAIVSPWFLVTSAACVEDVQHMYAVAGYKEYIRAEDLNDNPCTKATKKKIVFTCVPKAYDLDYTKLAKWSNNDIAVVKVESPFRFEDETYTKLCSYKPTAISVNYESKYQEPGTDAQVYGWGHNTIWRKPEDANNYNLNSLHFAPQIILPKQICKDAYKGHDMDRVIDRYMLCTLEGGNVDDKGEPIQKSKPLLHDGCATRQQKLMGAVGVSCEENNDKYYRDIMHFDQTRRNGSESSGPYTVTRRYGICQNDHGGPLVTWVGVREVLIGVASVFRVDNQSRCVGPFLFTSTQCNGAFLDCIIGEGNYRRSQLCNQPAERRGYDVIERSISWAEHPEGPAENEKLEMRPQIPLWNYGYGGMQSNNVPFG